MWDKIETYIVVTVIAALIWLYAEGETVKTYEVPVQVQFVSPPGQDLLIEPSAVVPVRMTIRSSASQYTLLKRMLDEEGPIRIPVEDTQGVERMETLRDRLLSGPIGDLSLTIETTDPASIGLRTEQRVEVTLPIEVVTGDLRLTGAPSFEPSQAVVSAPASLADKVRGMKLRADLSAAGDAGSWEPNVPQEVLVPLTLPEPVANAEVVPNRARVRFTIDRRTTTLTLPRVPLYVSAPPSLLERFDIVVPEESRFVRNVVLKGPADAIARIESGDQQVAAVLVFTSSDELRSPSDRKLPELRLPSNVTVDSPLERVEYQVVRRLATTPANPPVPSNASDLPTPAPFDLDAFVPGRSAGDDE